MRRTSGQMIQAAAPSTSLGRASTLHDAIALRSEALRAVYSGMVDEVGH
jgi:hypothetical protein